MARATLRLHSTEELSHGALETGREPVPMNGELMLPTACKYVDSLALKVWAIRCDSPSRPLQDRNVALKVSAVAVE